MPCYDWDRYRGFAKEIYNLDTVFDHETRIRNSISRYFYTAYHEAKLYALSRNLLKKTPQIRQKEVIDSFKNQQQPMNSISKFLQRLKNKREECDYDDDLELTEKDMVEFYQTCISEAEQVIKILKKYP
jgi:uncharacterized protein (UPF0332 family)